MAGDAFHPDPLPPELPAEGRWRRARTPTPVVATRLRLVPPPESARTERSTALPPRTSPRAGAARPGADGVVLNTPIEQPTDPRWVLAVRVSEALEGPMLRPEKRQRLIRLGKLMGLTAFDANLVIAIMQDQARRGLAPSQCPAAGAAQLRMIPRPQPRRTWWQSERKLLTLAYLFSAIIALELLVLWWLFR